MLDFERNNDNEKQGLEKAVENIYLSSFNLR